MRALLIAAVLLIAGQNAGTLSLEGVVVKSPADPVAGAQVRIFRSGSSDVAAQTVTDAQGSFVFRGLDPAGYTIVVEAPGYVTQAYGAPLGSQASPEVIDPAALAPTERVVVRLIGDGVIAGRVTSQNGEPLLGIQITAYSPGFDAHGWPLLRREHVAQSDDRGEYRLSGITSGEYYIVAQTSPIALLESLALRQNTGDSPIEILVNSTPRSPGLFVPMYFPGVDSLARATAVSVKSGSELRDVHIVLTRQRTYAVRGRVIDPMTGTAPEKVPIRSFPVMETPAGLGSAVAYRPDGSFELSDVIPGLHWITVQVPGIQFPPRGAVLVRVTGADVEGVEIKLIRDFTINGTIRIDGVPAGSLAGLADLTPQLVPVNAFSNSRMGTVQLRADATFSISDLIGAQYQFVLSGLPPEFYIRQARLGVIDLLAERPMITAPPDARLDVVLSRGHQVDGLVRDASGMPASGINVVLIPAGGLSQRNLYKTAVSDSRGQFSIRGVAPGNYKAYAWQTLEPYRYFDEAFVRAFQEKGISIRVSDANLSGVDLVF